MLLCYPVFISITQTTREGRVVDVCTEEGALSRKAKKVPLLNGRKVFPNDSLLKVLPWVLYEIMEE